MVDLLVTILLRRVTYRPAKFIKPKNSLLILMAISFTGCSMVQQKLDPNIFYKRDIQMEINGESFTGVGVPKKAGIYEIKIKASGVIDMLTVTSCHREETFETSHEFWESGKTFVYKYSPIHGVEDISGCLLDIGAYEKLKGRHSWATVDFQTEGVDLPAQILCGGSYLSFGGTSICQTKAGLLQKINFDTKVKVSPDNERCNVMRTTNEKEYTFILPKGECTYFFGSADGKFHKLTTIGYEGILIREVR